MGPDVKRKGSVILPKVAPKSPSSFYLNIDFFRYSPSNHHLFGQLLKEKLCPKNFQKSPNLVTLVVSQLRSDAASAEEDKIWRICFLLHVNGYGGKRFSSDGSNSINNGARFKA